MTKKKYFNSTRLIGFLHSHPSWVFAASQVAVGLINYLFQVWAAKVLPLVEFGAFSGWFAQFSTVLFMGLWFQSMVTLKPKVFSNLGKPVLLISIFVLAVFSITFTLAGFSAGQMVVGWSWALLVAGYYGVLFAQQRLLAVAIGTMLTAVSKFLIVFYLPELVGFKLAVEMSPALAAMLGFVVTQVKGFRISADRAAGQGAAYATGFGASADADARKSAEWSAVILSSLCLALVTALVPQLDLLVAKNLLNNEELGAFARVALLYKGFFFLFMIGAQILLTHQIRGRFMAVPLIQFVSIYALGIFFSIILGRGLPYIGAPSEWVVGSLIHIVSLTMLFFLVQRAAALWQWRMASIVTLMLFLELLVSNEAKPPLASYFKIVALPEAFVLAAFFWFSRSKSPVKRSR